MGERCGKKAPPPIEWFEDTYISSPDGTVNFDSIGSVERETSKRLGYDDVDSMRKDFSEIKKKKIDGNSPTALGGKETIDEYWRWIYKKIL